METERMQERQRELEAIGTEIDKPRGAVKSIPCGPGRAGGSARDAPSEEPKTRQGRENGMSDTIS